jgi:CRISPR-associated protein Cmr1
MSRKDPIGDVPAVKPVEKAGYITQIRKYKAITPLYGGGVEPAEADPISVVRAPEVRGQLRFWWRATRGGSTDGSLQDMKRREEEMWGSAGEKSGPGPSQVTVRILEWEAGEVIKEKDVNTRQGRRRVDIADPRSPWSYVAFPLRATDDMEAGSVRSDVSFGMELAYPDKFNVDIEAALWGWETFGGIGARTRRGFGALECTKVTIHDKSVDPIKPSIQNSKQFIEDGLNKHLVNGKWPDDLPHLRADLQFKLVVPKGRDTSAWEFLFRALQRFRQEDARHGKKYGLSLWPEANEIRRLFGREPKFPENVSDAEPTHKFPRAAFGLPVPFNMPHDAGLPQSLSLQGVQGEDGREYDRFASPLILRPIACSDGEIGLAAILACNSSRPTEEPHTPPGGLMLKGAPGDPKVKSRLTNAEAQKIPILNGETDVLKAFMKYLDTI